MSERSLQVWDICASVGLWDIFRIIININTTNITLTPTVNIINSLRFFIGLNIYCNSLLPTSLLVLPHLGYISDLMIYVKEKNIMPLLLKKMSRLYCLTNLTTFSKDFDIEDILLCVDICKTLHLQKKV